MLDLKDLPREMARPAGVKPLTALQDRAVYGPIASRRLGLSLGINPLPVSYKFCDFDCVYCQYGWTPEKGTGEKLKTLPALLDEIEESFKFHRTQGTPVKCLTLAGNGEPTLYPDFLGLVKGLRELRDQYFPGVPIGILSDSSQAHRPQVSEALALLEERYMKLDAGEEKLVREVNRPRGGFDFERMVEALSGLRDSVIQSLFMEGSHDNTAPEALEAWARVVARIKPREVQVYTIDRGPADPGLREVPVEKLEEIARFCQAKTGVRSVVFD